MLKLSFFLFPVLLLAALSANAQTPPPPVEDQMRAMQAEIEALKTEVKALKEEVQGSLPLVKAQVAEQAQTKVESSSKFPVKFFGTIASNTFWNSNDTDWLDIPNIATANNGGSFSSSLRQTRIGASVDGPEIGAFKTSGVLVADFFGGISNFATGQTMGVPRLLYAYMRLDRDRTAFEIGQDQMIVAPRNPTSLASMAFPGLYKSGNLYLRTPQLRIEQRLGTGPLSEFRATVGILAPIAGDLSTPALQFVPPNLAGERSRKPSFQARLSWRAEPPGPYEKPLWEFGASGHYSQEKFAGATFSSWVWSVDGDLTINRIGFGGEFFTGQNTDAFGGGAGPYAKGRGGFAEVRVQTTRHLAFNGGYGSDRVYRWSLFAPSQRTNSGAYGNAIYQFTPEFSAALEYRRQRTNSAGNTARNNNMNLTFAYSF